MDTDPRARAHQHQPVFEREPQAMARVARPVPSEGLPNPQCGQVPYPMFVKAYGQTVTSRASSRSCTSTTHAMSWRAAGPMIRGGHHMLACARPDLQLDLQHEHQARG